MNWRIPAFAPFRIESFRFQWPADLLASWAFEMEGLILGWFVLVETGSVLALALFGSLQFLGTLISPLFGHVGDRIGFRSLLLLMRAAYLATALILAGLFVAGIATPVIVFVLATIVGLVRPSDITLRSLLVGETMPAELLMPAMSVARTTADLARAAGALTGAALVAWLGMGSAYLGVCAVYLASLLLTFGVGVRRVRVLGETKLEASPFSALKEAFAYVWATPDVRAAMLLAFTINFAAYPAVNSLLAYVAREIYRVDQTGLGWLVASFSGGALLGSILLSTWGARIPPARTMLISAMLWFAVDFAFSWVESVAWGKALLFAAGFAQSFCMVPMAVLLLRTASPAFRGRVMGVRNLAVYGLPMGLLMAGQMVEYLGYSVTSAMFSLAGASFTLWIALRWREHLWRRDAPANS